MIKQHAVRIKSEMKLDSPSLECTSETLVNFLVVGVQKSGTTALHGYLGNHPDICLGRRKELHFFDNDQHFTGTPNYHAYHKHFPERHLNRSAVGECTPSYIFWPGAIERIYNYNPQMKVVAIMRDPSERAFSHWNMQRNRGLEPLEFLGALKEESQRCDISCRKSFKRFSYGARGYYARQVEEIWRYFSSDQTLFLRSEELELYPEIELKKVTDFLEINAFKSVEHENRHQRKYQRSMLAEEYRYLVAMYKADIHKLESLLGWDCSAWLRSERF